jgi:hypothetical protein
MLQNILELTLFSFETVVSYFWLAAARPDATTCGKKCRDLISPLSVPPCLLSKFDNARQSRLAT